MHGLPCNGNRMVIALTAASLLQGDVSGSAFARMDLAKKKNVVERRLLQNYIMAILYSLQKTFTEQLVKETIN